MTLSVTSLYVSVTMKDKYEMSLQSFLAKIAIIYTLNTQQLLGNIRTLFALKNDKFSDMKFPSKVIIAALLC